VVQKSLFIMNGSSQIINNFWAVNMPAAVVKQIKKSFYHLKKSCFLEMFIWMKPIL
jgi:hypothetical protein